MARPVGMWCLIAAESAIFSIFVVAYLFYVGKSLSGPTPSEVLRRAHLQLDLSVLQQPHDRAGRARHRARQTSERFGLWWLLTIALGAIFLAAPRASGTADLRRRADHQHQPLRHHLLLAGRPARVSRHRRPHRAVDHHDLHAAGIRATASTRNVSASSRCIGTSWMRYGSWFFGRVLHRAVSGAVRRHDDTATTRRPNTEPSERDDARADGVAVCARARCGAGICGAADRLRPSACLAR